MMSFLNPALLWALPLAAAPVVLHLIFLRRARRMPFSDLTLLRAAYARTLPATRLRQWLLMLVRCLILAGIVLAFARPVLHRRAAAAGGSEEGLDVVILLDTSWSMAAVVRGKSRLQWAAAAGSLLIGLLRPADRVAVAAFSDRIEGALAWAESLPAAREALSRHRVGNRNTDVGPALRSAYAHLAEREPGSLRRRVVVVLSDNAGHAFRALSDKGVAALTGYDAEVLLLGLGFEDHPDNAGIQEVRPAPASVTAALRRAEGTPRGAAERTDLSVRTALFAGERRAGHMDLWVRDRRVDSRGLKLDPGLGAPLTFRLPPGRSEEHWGRLELRRDALQPDDVYYFSLRVQPKPKVLLLYGSPRYLEAGRGGYFLKKLLSEGERLPYQLDVADLGRLDQVRLEEYGAVILADFRRMPSGMPEALERYVVRGGGLWLLAGTRAEPDTYHPLRRLLPGRLGPAESRATRTSVLVPAKVPGSAVPLSGTGSVPSQAGEGSPQRTVEGLSFAWNEFELRNVSIERRYRLSSGPGASIWFRDGSGRPLMLAGEFGQGRVLLWASSLDIGWSNLALKPVFTAWVDVGLRWLSRYSGRQKWRTLSVGEPIVRVWASGEAAPPRAQVRGPGGRRAVLIVRDRRLEYQDTREPGMYFLRPMGGTDTGREPGSSAQRQEGRWGADASPEAFAVNLDRTGPEGDLAPVSKPPWTSLRPDALREDFLRSVYGREVRTGALALVLVLLVMEAFLCRPRHRGADLPAPPRLAGGGTAGRPPETAVAAGTASSAGGAA
ncbi:MAG: BatA domain-containing protein [Elusimicrobiota bacterium]